MMMEMCASQSIGNEQRRTPRMYARDLVVEDDDRDVSCRLQHMFEQIDHPSDLDWIDDRPGQIEATHLNEAGG